jgi:hypothetical protein
MRRKYYSKDIKKKIKPTPLPFNVYYRGANGLRSEKLRQEHNILLLQRKRNQGKTSNYQKSKKLKCQLKNQRNKSSYKANDNISGNQFNKQNKKQNYQRKKGKSMKSKNGGKFNLYEFKKEYKVKNLLNKYGTLNSKKLNKWKGIECNGI